MTIIELVLILAIIASLAMIIIPLFESTYPEVSVEGEARRVMAEIREIRQKAIEENRKYRMLFIHGTDTIETSYIDEYGVEQESESMNIHTSIDLVGSTFPRDTLTFNLLGEPEQGGKIELAGTRKEKIYVNVDAETGKVTLGKEDE